jgi:RimJ/RimL family protein N-acetyltransferase
MELRGDRVALREWRLEDAPAVEGACGDPDIAYWIPWVPSPYTREDAEQYVRNCIESGDERYAFAVVDAETRELWARSTWA